MLKLSNIRHNYRQGAQNLEILRGADLEIRAGEIVALVAPSGAGKSTLLHIAGLLETPGEGEIYIDGQAAHGTSDRARSMLRSKSIGFVYQFHHLLPEFSALENIMLPQLIGGANADLAERHAVNLLNRMGLGQRAHHRPAQLSGGEQQRVAIIRALANNPKILLADEPTGNLDGATADQVFNFLYQLLKERNMAGLIVTHNMDLAQRLDRVLTLRDGKIAVI